jgi:hypothetical protein
MKVSASLVIFVATQVDAKFKAPRGLDKDGNKINGQHPKRRLQALNKFMCNWADDYMASEKKSDRFCERYTAMIHRLDAAFERDQCSYFNPNVKFGGPNPDPNMAGKVAAKNPNAKNPTKSRRLRRQAEKEDEEDCDIDDDECNEAALDGIDQCDEDDKQKLGSLCDSSKQDARQLSQPNRKLKRYSTGLAKWCERYVSECYGQRVHNHCVERAQKFLEKLAIADE